MAESDREFIQRSVRWAITFGVVATVGVAVLWLLKGALTPLAVAFVLAYLFDPIIDRFEARRVGRSVAIFLLLGAAIVLTLVFATLVVPKMQDDLVALSEALPGYVDRALGSVAPTLEKTLGIALPHSVQGALERVRDAGLSIPLDTLREWLGRAVVVATGTVGSLVALLLIPVFAYYLLVDFDRVTTRLLGVVPRRHQSYVAEKARTVDRLLAGFIRGQLTVCLLLAVLYSAGFAVIGIELAIVIGLTAGALAIIPYVGNAVALTAASLMCVLEFGFDHHLALVVAWYVLVQTLEGFVITPRIVGRKLDMHPMTVIVALLIGGDLLGFFGLLIAVPLAAVLQVFARELLEGYRRSPLYLGGDALDSDSAVT